MFTMQYWKEFELSELPIFTNLYKSFFSEKCPNCDVMIERTGGCKFMTCSKCKYQFCWYCLDEFYTEYHYHFSDCPFRMILFYILQALCLVFIVTKMYVINPRFRTAIETVIWLAYQLGILAGYGIIWFTAVDKSTLHNKTAELQRLNQIGEMYLSNRERRQKARLEVDIVNEKRNLKVK